MCDGSLPVSGGTRFLILGGRGGQVGRWAAIEPFASSGTWDGRVQFTDDNVTQVDLCEHSHESPAEAEQCAQSLAARLNARLMASGCVEDSTGRSRVGRAAAAERSLVLPVEDSDDVCGRHAGRVQAPAARHQGRAWHRARGDLRPPWRRRP
jgi:hypothetical protein